MRTSEDKSSIFRLSVMCFVGLYLHLHCISLPSQYLIWHYHQRFGNNCISLLFPSATLYPSVQLSSHSLFNSSNSFSPLLSPLDVPAQLTHMSNQAEHTCLLRSLAVCVRVSVLTFVYARVCVCVFCPAVRSDTTTKLDQFVKSREVWASRTNLLLFSR